MRLLAKQHDPRHLLLHGPSVVLQLPERNPRTDPLDRVVVKAPAQLLHSYQLDRAEVLKHYLNGRTPSKVSLVLQVVRWQGLGSSLLGLMGLFGLSLCAVHRSKRREAESHFKSWFIIGYFFELFD